MIVISGRRRFFRIAELLMKNFGSGIYLYQYNTTERQFKTNSSYQKISSYRQAAGSTIGSYGS